MIPTKLALAAIAASSAIPASAAVTVSLEAAGVQSTTRANTRTFGFEPGQATLLTFTNVGTSAADQFGGAGGTGTYGAVNQGLGNVNLSLQGSTNYFGLWVSALDVSNGIEFFSGGTGGTLVGGFNLFDAFNGAVQSGNYFGNPNSGANSGERYVYFNFDSTSAFDTVRLSSNANGGGRLEFDNVSTAVPEAATWAMMVIGFGVTGAALRNSRKRKVSFA